MHKSWGSYPICFRTLFVFNCYLIYFNWCLSPMTCLVERQTFCLCTLCHHRKCRGFGLFVGIFSLFGISYLIPWYIFHLVSLHLVSFSIMCWFGFWYNLDNSLACHTLVCLLGFLCILSKSCLPLVLEGLDMHIYFMYILWHVLLSLIQYIG